MKEPTIEHITMMAAQIFSGGDCSIKWAVKHSFQIWEFAIKELEERKQKHEIKTGAKDNPAGPVSP